MSNTKESIEQAAELYSYNKHIAPNIHKGDTPEFLKNYAAIKTNEFGLSKDDFIAGANHLLSLNYKSPEEVDAMVKKRIETEWLQVDNELKLTHFEQYWIVISETKKVTLAIFLDWDTEGVDDVWVIGDSELPLTYASHYSDFKAPKPPKF